MVVHYISSGIICGKLSYVSWYITTFPAVFELVFYQMKNGTYFPLCVKLPVLARDKSSTWAAASSLVLNSDLVILVKSQKPSKARSILKFKSALLRGVRSHCFCMMLDLYRVLWALDLLNMVMEHWIRGIHLFMVEPQRIRLLVDKHMQWKKRQKKSA